MITGKEVFRWAMGIAGALVTAVVISAAATLNDVDKNVVRFGEQLDSIAKQLKDHSATLHDHEQRIRNLENKARTR